MVLSATIATACMPRSKWMLSTRVISHNRSELGYFTRLNLCSCSIFYIVDDETNKDANVFKISCSFTANCKVTPDNNPFVNTLQFMIPKYSYVCVCKWIPNECIPFYYFMHTSNFYLVSANGVSYIHCLLCNSVHEMLFTISGVGDGRGCIRTSLKSEISIMKWCET